MSTYLQLKDEIISIASVVAMYPENVKPKVFDILVDAFKSGSLKKEEETEILDQVDGLKPKKSKGILSKKNVSESYTIDRNLNLRGNGNIASFKSFFNEKQPTSKAEINAVATYYLKVIMQLPVVTLDQAYTCYKEVNQRPADHFKQSFRDTKNKEGYIEFDEQWNLLIPQRGQNFVEHDLPKKKKDKK